ncbi:MAG: carcinine hydrolase/isopenicillin-N N-acyltransferase family protein [Myxococcota bacterium]
MCDTLAVVSSDGCLFAKNSDRDPNEAQALDWQPRAKHAPGARVRCTWIDVPQVPATHAVLLSRPFWMFGAEIGANEHGVAIGNEAVFTREPYAATGLTGMDLLRLALERAATADDAVQVIVSLLEQYGQGGGCGHENRAFTYHNSFLVADPRGAIVLETAGRHHATERVSGARSISNVLTIPAFARAHSDRIKTRVAGGRARLARTSELGRLAKSPAELMAVLRDHGAGRRWPVYTRATGAMRAPCMHAGGLVAASQTTASWVAELHTGHSRHWVTATAAPCLAVFKPVRVTEPLDLGPVPTDRFDPATLWWRQERLHRRLIADPARLAEDYAAERDALEAQLALEQCGPAEAFARADALLARWLERVSLFGARDRRPPIARAYWRKRDARAGLEPARA